MGNGRVICLIPKNFFNDLFYLIYQKAPLPYFPCHIFKRFFSKYLTLRLSVSNQALKPEDFQFGLAKPTTLIEFAGCIKLF